MNGKLAIACGALAWCTCSAPTWAAESPTIEWSKAYHRAGWLQMAYGVAVDQSGNVIVTGLSTPSASPENIEIDTIKYDADGHQIRRATYPGETGTGVAVDKSGNIYVSGIGDCLLKYSPGLELVWTITTQGVENSVAADEDGNIYATASGQAGLNVRVVKYNTDGGVIWDKETDCGASESSNGIAVDGSGSVYVVGDRLDVVGSSDILTVKLDANGDAVWVRTFDSGSTTDHGRGVAVDSSGNVYVAGWPIGGGPQGNTLKYAPDGQLLRQMNYPSIPSFLPTAVAVDKSDNVYVTGGGVEACAGSFITRKYDSSGEVVWDICSPILGTPYGIAVNGSGDVYITGLQTTDGSDVNYFTIKYGQTYINESGEDVVLFPNPVTGDTLKVSIVLDKDVPKVDAEIYDMSFKRVFSGTWNDVHASEGGITITGIGGLAPGYYLVRASVTSDDGSKKTYKPAKFVKE